jgi:hypothetical protein
VAARQRPAVRLQSGRRLIVVINRNERVRTDQSESGASGVRRWPLSIIITSGGGGGGGGIIMMMINSIHNKFEYK